MFDVETTCEVIRKAIAELEISSSTSPSTSEIADLISTRELLNSTCDQLLARYESSGAWSGEGYLSAQQNISYTTGCFAGSVKKSLSKGHFLNANPAIKDAIDERIISYDHITPLVPLAEDRYQQFFADDSTKLLEMAALMPAAKFSRAITQWKYFVDEVIESDDEIQRYEERFLHIYETEFGYWKINGKLDPVTGRILKKAIDDIRSQLWQEHNELKATVPKDERLDEFADEYTSQMQKADAIGYLAQGYVSASIAADAPLGHNPKHNSWFSYKVADPEQKANKSFHFSGTSAVVADVVININDLKPKTSTREFIEKCISEDTPFINTHSRSYLEQILCDCAMEAPIKLNESMYDLGRSVRTAPPKLKKQLLLNQDTCTIQGCSTPAKWCDAHHIKHWAHGGKTSLDNLALICRRHHSMMHHDVFFAERTKPKLKQKPRPMARTG